MQQIKTKIITNQKVAPDHYVLSFKTRGMKEKTKPGQFFNIRISNSHEVLLRRPFSAHKIYKQRIEILYKVVGKATKILSSKKKGDSLDVIGPLGNGFKIESSIPPSSIVLVAGGHGAAPLYALAAVIARPRRSRGRSNLSAFIGARSKKHVVCDKDLAKLGAKVYVATEDGSKGYRGLITNLLKKHLQNTTGTGEATIYA
ncbi:MAG: FAD-binding oxidoreductase, partial [Candidatus Omnitrophota bacterium]